MIELRTCIEEIGLDSLDLVELVMGIEEEFGITVPQEDVEQIKTIEDAIRYIERHRKNHTED